jgi:hypothetical protein
VGRGDRAREAVRQLEVDSTIFGETIECPGLVEAVHLDRIFDGFANPPERQSTARLARDGDDAAIQARRKRSIGFDFGGAGVAALFQRREVQVVGQFE